ncbi:protein FAM161B [Polymixia lowei]
MSELEALLLDGLRAEQNFQYQLKALKEAHRQQLQETERRQQQDLERRINRDSLLSTDVDEESTWVSSATFRTSRATHRETQQIQQQALSNKQLAHVSKEEEAEAECQRKFHAVPVPNHVSLPLYHEMMQLREKERKQGHDQRKNFLLSTQKPFSFLERDKEKREKLLEMLSQAAQTKKNKGATIRNPVPKVKEATVCQLWKDEELSRRAHIEIKGRETVTDSTAPNENHTQTGSPKLRSAERTKKEMLAFLDEKPSFQPKINPQVPDFSRLHKAFQTEALRKAESKDVTQCRPFHLRTSTLPTRQSRMSPENSQKLRTSNHLKRSSSFGGLTSLSTDTLPLYITDAARKRGMAIRKSVELKDSKSQESADWMTRYHVRSQAMKKTVTIRAKVMDPHSSLKEVYHEKLQRHREADQQRVREYMKELRDMKARVTVRPYLFEQAKQKSAKAHAEQTYRNKLKEAGLNEHFVEANGGEVEVTPVTSSSEDDLSIGNDIQIREENVDDGKKIEEVEEKSVKSKENELA